MTADATLTTSSTATAAYTNANAITGSNRNLTLQGGSGAGGGSTISGEISLSTGSLTKLQGGTWVLSNAAGNTYSGGTAVSGGTLTVTNTSNSGTGSGNVTIGTGTTIGTLNVGNGGAGGEVSGDIAFTNTSNTSVVNFNRTTDSTYGGNLTGANGTVNKVGSGKLVLTGTNSYGGATNVNGGILQVDGTHSGTGAVTINNGGTLAGSGAISGPVTVKGGGTLAPGSSIESLDVGALSFNGNSTFAYEIDSNAVLTAAADLVNASGSLSIAAGAILAISDAANVFLTPGTKFTLISYAGAWDSGTFDAHPDDSSFALGANLYVIDYNDTTGGVNFGGGPGTLKVIGYRSHLGNSDLAGLLA